jgi:hypothetical protein
MRKCLLGDLVELAALIAPLAPDQRASLASQLIEQADFAHRYAKRFARAHAVWGNGSLMARALAEPGPRLYQPAASQFLSALALVSATLAARKQGDRLASVATPAHMIACAQNRRSRYGRNQRKDCHD